MTSELDHWERVLARTQQSRHLYKLRAASEITQTSIQLLRRRDEEG
jgi:hypothetical protein